MSVKVAIWKYEIRDLDSQTLSIPRPARVVSAGLDPAGKLCIWAFVCTAPDTEEVETTIRIVGTGIELSKKDYVSLDGRDHRFIGTVIQGELVHHIFWKIN